MSRPLDTICCVVNYCTNDFRFLDPCLNKLKGLGAEIVVPVCDHFFDGKEEDRPLLELSYAQHSDVHFVEFEFSDRVYGLSPILYSDDKRAHYWHSTARYVGAHFIPDKCTHVLFLDVDEIIDEVRFTEWLESGALDDFNAIRFDSFLYMLKSTRRALDYTQNALLVKREALHPDALLLVGERMATFERIKGEKVKNMRGWDDKPLFHHYAWVRANEELFRKVACWGHRDERDWVQVLNDELKNPRDDYDSIFELDLEECPSYFDPLTTSIEERVLLSKDRWVTKVDRESILRRHFETYY